MLVSTLVIQLVLHFQSAASLEVNYKWYCPLEQMTVASGVHLVSAGHLDVVIKTL